MSDLQKAKDAIDDFFSDTSRKLSETRAGLEELASDIEMKLESLNDDEV